MQVLTYLNRDNTAKISLSLNGAPWSASQASKIEISTPKGSVDSVSNPAMFAVADDVTLKLGSAGWPAGAYWARIIVYTDAWPRGVVWGDQFKLIIQSA